MFQRTICLGLAVCILPSAVHGQALTGEKVKASRPGSTT
jgi:hypothetical protein